MTRRHLFGPVPAPFAADHLHDLRAAGTCKTFGFEPGPAVDLVVDDAATWPDLLAGCGPDWAPEFLALWLPYAVVPPALWDAPVPVAGLCTDWNLLWHGYRRAAARCDVVFTDRPGVDVFHRAGVAWARPANLFGLGRPYRAYPWPAAAADRDIDVLFVGNPHPAVQRGRLPWVGRLARLAGRHRVVVRGGVYGDRYRALLARAKVVFNRSIRGECNQRAFEAAAAGAALLQERENADVPHYFAPDAEYAPYGPDDLEPVVERLLARPDERAAMATAARARAAGYGFEALWAAAVDALDPEWAAVLGRAAARRPCGTPERLRLRAALAVGATHAGRDARLPADLAAAAADAGRGAVAAVARVAVAAAQGADPADLVGPARRAADGAPADPLARANLAEVLDAAGDPGGAAAAAGAALDLLAAGGRREPADPWLYPPGYRALRVEWERAGWAHPDDPAAAAAAQGALLAAHLHGLLAARTGDLAHYEAAAREPAFPRASAALGCALARAGRAAEAVPHLRAAVAADPFDLPAARALYQALGDAGDGAGQAALAADARLLHAAAPGAVPREPWFDGPPRTRVVPLTRAEFAARYGDPDTSGAVIGYTNPVDTHAVLTLLAHFRPSRVLEVGTAAGHMTANLAAWSPDEATVFSLGDVADVPAGRAPGQAYETPKRAAFGRFADHLGAGHKVCLVAADSRAYDFSRLAPLDFAFVDGAHDLAHVLSDTRQVYAALAPGGVIAWHDFGSATPWVEVRRAVEAAGLAEPVHHVEGTEVAFLVKQADAPAPVPLAARRAPDADRRVAVRWEGEVAAVHSLALVNRSLAAALAARGHPVTVRPTARDPGVGPADPGPAGRLVGRGLPGPAAVTVRHRWPPDLSPAAEGRLVVIQPWEFGRVPAAWVPAIAQTVAEVWVPSHYARQCFLDSGVPAAQVHVVPNGVDVAVFRPGLKPLPLATRKALKFLFVGGTIWRKGFDVLLAAYGKAFTSADDVCLVVKDLGAGTFYRGQTAGHDVDAFRARPDAPEVEYRADPLTEAEVAGLYAACDVLVHPYRGEGFGLPVAEAMACGLPVVVTAGGATDDWCDDANSYRVPARRADLPDDRVGDLPTAGRPWVLEPDPVALADLLRHVAARPAERAARGRAGCATVRGRLTWAHAARAAEARLRALTAGAGAAAPDPAAPARRPRVSLTMIVKDEEHHLPDCLASVRDLVDEVVVVDTGSADRTKDIARSFGARVFDFPWVDDFAAARNAALGHATGDWAFWMDADDRLDAENRDRLRALLADLPAGNVAYSMKCRCVGGSGGATTVDHLRLFRNRPEHRWRYRIHEQILPAVRRTGGEVRWADVVVTHVGYADRDARARKLARDLRLLELEYAQQPGDPFTLFNLGNVYQELGREAEALPLFERSLAGSNPKDSIVRKLYALVAQTQRRLGRPAEALGACAAGREHYPDDAELLFVEALARRDAGDAGGAEDCLKRLLTGRDEAAQFASVAEGLRGHKARHNLAVLYLDGRREAEAEAEWRRALADQPGFLPAHTGLGEVLLRQKRWDEVEAAAAGVEALGPDGQAAAEALRGRARMERGEVAAARWSLGRAAARFPQSLTLRVLHSHAALREGLDREAEAALVAVLDLAPGHPEARKNLAVLRARRALRPGEDLTAAGLYAAACARDEARAAALVALHELARGCGHVTELGAGTGAATAALLAARPARLVVYDRTKEPELDLLGTLAGKTAFEFRPVNGADPALDPTDLLVLHAPAGPAGVAALVGRHAEEACRMVAVLGPPGAGPDWVASAVRDVPDGFRTVGKTSAVVSLIVLERERVAAEASGAGG